MKTEVSKSSYAKIIVLTGPTASGKTDLAIRLALRCNGEIISVDSRQIYQGLDSGTGKPTPEQCQQVKHHLLSVVAPEKTVTAEDFSKMAKCALQTIHARGKICFLVGGTGLWIRSFIDGLAPVPPADPALRARLNKDAEQKGNLYIYRQLEKVDPETAQALHPGDRLRIIRALEIFILTGDKASVRRKQVSTRPPWQACWFGVIRPREVLYRLAEERIDVWLRKGWCAEVRNLLGRGVPAEAPAMQAIGYSHLVRHLQGEYSLERAAELIKRDTRRYIKRQMTWFRAENRITWLDPTRSIEEIMLMVKTKVETCGWSLD